MAGAANDEKMRDIFDFRFSIFDWVSGFHAPILLARQGERQMESEATLRSIRDGTLVERECLLFEAGDYPDRGVTITPGDLQAIATNTLGELPVRIEHLRESPFDG